MSDTPAEAPTEEQLHEDPPPQPVQDPEQGPVEPEDPEADTPPDEGEDDTGAGEEEQPEEAPEPQPEPPAAPPAPDTASRIEEVSTALYKAAKSYSKRVGDILEGDSLGITVCPLCATDFPGLLTPAPRSDEAIAAVRPIIGLPDLTTYAEDRYARGCDRCAGRGKTLTGSRVPEYATMRCPDCNGTGFKTAETGVASAPVNGHDAPMIAPTHEDEMPPVGMPQASIDALEKMLEAARNQGVAR